MFLLAHDMLLTWRIQEHLQKRACQTKWCVPCVQDTSESSDGHIARTIHDVRKVVPKFCGDHLHCQDVLCECCARGLLLLRVGREGNTLDI
eukprot:6480293-Amphidinium_carterae.2